MFDEADNIAACHPRGSRGLERLQERLAQDGDPPITMEVDGRELVLSANTAPIMLRSRVAAALEDVAGEQAFEQFQIIG
jgi:hypothetical protein